MNSPEGRRDLRVRMEGVLRLYDDETKVRCPLYRDNKQFKRRGLAASERGHRSFTRLTRLMAVVYECFDDPRTAIAREKEIKGWRRERKNATDQKMNPKWRYL